MSLTLNQRTAELARRVCRRDTSFFAADLETCRERVDVSGKTVLVVGGAGTIGAATLLELLRFRPARVIVMDTSENNLAELVRTVRSQREPYQGDLRVAPLDYGSSLAAAYLASLPKIDVVLCFAALKHVRSERDVFSCLALLDVNVLRADRFLKALRSLGHGRDGVFFVSTDKAAAPASVMGASKRLMELVLWSHSVGPDRGTESPSGLPLLPRTSTVRFANVAYSDGSLPWAFLQRIEKRQPLGAPRGVRRYFVTAEEAGQLCLLAARACPHRHLFIPRLDPDEHTATFPEIARETLASFGYEPAWYDDETSVRGAIEAEIAAGRYPVVLTAADTSGEKPMEVFSGPGETPVAVGLTSVDGIEGRPVESGSLVDLLAWLERLLRPGAAPPTKAEVIRRLSEVIPELQHQETGATLDARI